MSPSPTSSDKPSESQFIFPAQAADNEAEKGVGPDKELAELQERASILAERLDEILSEQRALKRKQREGGLSELEGYHLRDLEALQRKFESEEIEVDAQIMRWREIRERQAKEDFSKAEDRHGKEGRLTDEGTSYKH